MCKNRCQKIFWDSSIIFGSGNSCRKETIVRKINFCYEWTQGILTFIGLWVRNTGLFPSGCLQEKILQNGNFLILPFIFILRIL